MAGPLLLTKSYIPRLHASLVARPHLIQQLEAALDQKLALISAPAGFGKTTLLSRWVRERDSDDRPVQFAWLSLDRADNDPVRFLAYMLMSLQKIDPRIGQAELEALKSAGFAKASSLPALEEILTALINQIAACVDGASEPVGQLAESSAPDVCGDLVLVLDDYHVIEAQAVHDAVTLLLERMPPGMHLAIVTRTDPPLPVARLRGQGQVTELRQDDLVFTPEEASQFLNGVMGLHLSHETVAALAARTEGWIAGLQMAAVSMQGRKDTAAFVEAFTGSDRFIMDYLTSEVLDRQPTHVQTFLLQTSVLERLTGPLCDAVIGNRAPHEPASNGSPSPTWRLDLDPVDLSSQAILEYLERDNLFVVAQDDHRQWYRYHHLFSDLLRQRLRQTQPDVVPSLHQRASEWYEHQGLMQDAIHHALSAGAYERAACLIERAAEPAWMHSEVATFLEWVASLPAEIVQARPMLGIYQAIGLLMDGRPLDAIDSELQRTTSNARAATAAQDVPISGGLLVFRALVAAYQGRSQESVELTRRALQDVPEGNLFLRSLLSGILGLAHMYSGDFTAADRALREAATRARQAGNVMNTVLALCHLAELCSLAGQLHSAQSLYEEALSVAVDGGGGRLPIAGIACIGLGNLQFLWNDLNRAAEYLQQGIELARRWGEAGILRGYSSLARVKIAQGDVAGAHQLLQTAERIAARFDVTEVDDLSVDMQKAELSIAEGNWQAAMAWAEKRGLTLDPKLVHLDIEKDRHLWLHRYFRQREYITLAKLLIPIGLIGDKVPSDGRLPKSSEALEVAAGLLAQLQPALEEKEEILHLVELLSLQGLALAALGHKARALAAVERALLLARSGGLVRPFVEGGQSMASLLREAVSRNTAPEYARHLLAELGAPGFEEQTEPRLSTSEAVGGRGLLVEPLTEREFEVLRYLPSSLTTTEMAEHLFISVNTVRSHIRSIYGKLGVHSRHEAIACAEQLGLLQAISPKVGQPLPSPPR